MVQYKVIGEVIGRKQGGWLVMSYQKLIGLSLLIIVMAVSFALVYNWRTPPSHTSLPPPAGERPGVIVERPVIKHTEEGKLSWQLRLKKIHISAGGQNIAAQGVQEALIYGAEGKPIVRVSAQQVVGNTAQRDFEVAGDVRVVSYRGALITTDKVQWSQGEQEIICPGEVTLSSRDAIIVTTGLNYYVNQDLVDCPNQVTMWAGDNKVVGQRLQFNVETGDFTIQSVQMIFNAEEAKQKLREAMGG